MSNGEAKQCLVDKAKRLYVMRPFNRVRELAIEAFDADCFDLGLDRNLIAWQAKMSLKIDSL